MGKHEIDIRLKIASCIALLGLNGFYCCPIDGHMMGIIASLFEIEREGHGAKMHDFHKKPEKLLAE